MLWRLRSQRVTIIIIIDLSLGNEEESVQPSKRNALSLEKPAVKCYLLTNTQAEQKPTFVIMTSLV